MTKTLTPEYVLGLLAETDKKLDRLTTSQAKTDQQLIANTLAHAENEISIKELRRSQADTDKQIKELAKMFGGLGNSLGDVAEEYFFNSLEANPIIGNIKFDRVESNRRGKHAASGKRFEFDMMLINGKALAILETKHKATKEAINQLERAVEIAREVMPEYKKHAIYGGIASFAIDEKLKALAQSKGFFVLQRSGETFVADTGKMRAF